MTPPLPHPPFSSPSPSPLSSPPQYQQLRFFSQPTLPTPQPRKLNSVRHDTDLSASIGRTAIHSAEVTPGAVDEGRWISFR
ncbi:hypothetical protein EX30DRAFT_344577 [Ascodesmis nigricans]|uniref:Uncharacterized protein n=1 Tax=Ascodesmis nigricans TaxID=341454 RepID=A0A4S2MJ98_9PEZI|nr:hypothetical protein EX30DRAFT_344577 [Ascodesmis nigricans]